MGMWAFLVGRDWLVVRCNVLRRRQGISVRGCVDVSLMVELGSFEFGLAGGGEGERGGLDGRWRWWVEVVGGVCGLFLGGW